MIIAGGSGSRLWPLSTPDYPKHLLPLASEKSLLQNAYERAKKLAEHVYVIPEVGHIQHVKEQLPELSEGSFIVEPARRGTAACILAGLHHVAARHDVNEPIAFLHADHVIRDVDGFEYSFKKAAEASAKHSKITLIGIEPDAPATGFGYIKKAEAVANGTLIYKVEGFKEKPDFETAKRYLQSGKYLWNCGYFVGSVNTFVDAFEKYSPQWKGYYDQLMATKTEDDYKNTYLSFENDAIDYALMEKCKELLVIPANFDWMDVGSFEDVHKVSSKDEDGNASEGGNVHILESEQLFVHNQEDKPVAIIGLDNVTVVNTKHGLLVMRTDQSQKVKQVVEKIKEKNA